MEEKSPLRRRAESAGLKLDLDVSYGHSSATSCMTTPRPIAPDPECKSPPTAPEPTAIDAHASADPLLLRQTLEALASGLSPRSSRIRCAHELARRLADMRTTPSLRPCVLEVCGSAAFSAQLGKLVAETAEEEAALGRQVVLSLLTNLSFYGLTQQLAAQAGLPKLIIRALLATDDPAMRQFALPAAYNFSSEAVLLREIASGRETLLPLLRAVAARDDESGKFARHTLINLERFMRAEQLQMRKKLPRPASAPAMSLKFLRSGKLEFRRACSFRKEKEHAAPGEQSDAASMSALPVVAEQVTTPRSRFFSKRPIATPNREKRPKPAAARRLAGLSV